MQVELQTNLQAKSIPQNNLQDQRQCRICLDDINQYDLISPCKCIGSVGYVHQKCLMKWISTSLSRQLPKQQQQGIYSIKCQMCAEPIKFSMDYKRNCNSLEQIINLFKQKPLIYTVYLVLLICMICMIIYLSYWYTKRQSQKNAHKVQPWMWIILIVLICIFCLTTLKIIYDLVTSLLLNIQYKVIQILNNENRQDGKNEC